MYFEKHLDHLTVRSNIYFDNNIFCGRPYIYLIAFKDKPHFGWDGNIIGIAVHDSDDFDIGLIYKTDTKHFKEVLHELINWMHDHEKGISSLEKLINPKDFFPDCGCERSRW